MSQNNTKKTPHRPKTIIHKEDSKQKLSFNFKIALLLAVISFAVYANTLKNSFVLDDAGAITNNTIVTKGISAIPEILTTPYRKGILKTSNDYYRPLSLIMFATEYEFFGTDPKPYHFFTILLFAGCVILLFIFISKLLAKNGTGIAFFTALLFALHPIHTEVVANIKSCDELLCFFFAFLSLNLFMGYMETGKNSKLIIASCCFFLSLISKETSITFLVIIPLVFFFIKNENKKRSTYITTSAILATLIFLAIRSSVLSANHANEITDVLFIDNALAKRDLSFESRIATAILILGLYVKLLFVPYPLICDYSFNSIPFVHFSDLKVIISLLVFIALAIISIKRFLKNKKDPYAFGIIFFLITISLFSNIPFLIGTTMGERLLFFPSVGFCLIVALLINKLAPIPANESLANYKEDPKVWGVIAAICLVYGAITINRNNDWINSITLYKNDIIKSPDDSRLNFYIGNELTEITYPSEKDTAQKRQIINESIHYLKKVLEIYPQYQEAHKEIGRAYFFISNFDSAEVYDQQAILQNPASSFPYNNLGAVYAYKGKYPEAIQLFKKAIELNPGDATQHANMGYCYLHIRKYDSAIFYLNKAILIDPDLNLSYQLLASIYKETNLQDSSRKYEAIAKKNNPLFKL